MRFASLFFLFHFILRWPFFKKKTGCEFSSFYKNKDEVCALCVVLFFFFFFLVLTLLLLTSIYYYK